MILFRDILLSLTFITAGITLLPKIIGIVLIFAGIFIAILIIWIGGRK